MTLVVDMDGTLCDITHRVHLAQAGLWDTFHSALMNDEPHRDVVWFLDTRAWKDHYTIAVTGRPNRYRTQTWAWLEKWNLMHLIDEVVMRPDDDYRSDSVLKIQLLEERFGSRSAVLDSIKLALDDRDNVVQAYREYGLPCWQVREGTY